MSRISTKYLDEYVDEHWREVIGSRRRAVVGQFQQAHNGFGTINHAT